MKRNINNSNCWITDEGKTFIRKSDNFDMGEEIWLGVNDTIENYEEKEVNYDD